MFINCWIYIGLSAFTLHYRLTWLARAPKCLVPDAFTFAQTCFCFFVCLLRRKFFHNFIYISVVLFFFSIRVVYFTNATAYNTGKHQHRASRHYCGLWKWAYLLITPTILSFVSVPRSDLVSQHENCGGGYISTILVQTYIVHMNIYIYSHSYWRAEQLSSNTVRCSRVKWSHYAKTRRLDSIVATERQNRDRKSVMDLSQRMRKRKMVGRVGTLGNILCADCSCAWENVYRFVSVFISCSINFEFRLFHGWHWNCSSVEWSVFIVSSLKISSLIDMIMHRG